MKNKILKWASEFPLFACLDSGRLHSNYSQVANVKFEYASFDILVGVKLTNESIPAYDFQELRKWIEHNPEHKWLFGYFAYDLKNELELLKSQEEDFIKAPLLQFFEADIVVGVDKKGELKICYTSDPEFTIDSLFNSISEISVPYKMTEPFQLHPRVSYEQYLDDVNKLKGHIENGDIYEVNYCQEFYSENAEIHPLEFYITLSERSPAPFSAFCKFNDHFILSQSPERFVKKMGNKIISQPIKGTVKRSPDEQKDLKLIKQLGESQKDFSENVMIVDLVRNDLSKFAKEGSVVVEELCGVYSFKDVHHMMSTISCMTKSEINPIDIITSVFPMGSMTGAPKVRAMQLIDQYEHSCRGIFSGTLGYITPENNFDFNVVIRSVIYNRSLKRLSAMAGGAITAGSDPTREYNESLLKLQAILDVVSSVGKLEIA